MHIMCMMNDLFKKYYGLNSFKTKLDLYIQFLTATDTQPAVKMFKSEAAVKQRN